MCTSLDLYALLAKRYIDLIRTDSVQAASVLEEMNTRYGAVMIAHTLVAITLIKIDVLQGNWLASREVFAQIIDAYPEAAPMIQTVMSSCLEAWGIAEDPNGSWTAH